MKGSKGFRKGTRNLRVKPRNKGKLKIRNYLREFEKGDKVAIRINPQYQEIPHPRFHGRIGKVVGNQGRAYFVKVKDGKSYKTPLVSPEHLSPVKE